MKLTKYVKAWLARAEDDIRTMEILLKEGGPARVVCFHSQQAAEKYLKAFLAHRGKHIRKVHDLDAILSECVKLAGGFKDLQEPTEYLTQFYLTVRYPADVPEFSLKQAKKAHSMVLEIKEKVLDSLT